MAVQNPHEAATGVVDEQLVYEQCREDLDSLSDAHNTQFAQMRRDAGFARNEYEDPAFWTVVTNYANENVGDDFPSIMRAITLSFPKELMDQAWLGKSMFNFRGEGENSYTATLRMTGFISLLERAVKANPGLSYSSLKEHLENVAADTILDDKLLSTADETITALLRGVRCQLAFEQVLEARRERTGLGFRRATEREDVAGADFVVQGRREWFPVDVKASTAKFRSAADDGKAYMIDGNHTYVFAGAPDRAFGDGFFLPDDLVTSKLEPYMSEQVLDRIESEKLARRTRYA